MPSLMVTAVREQVGNQYQVHLQYPPQVDTTMLQPFLIMIVCIYMLTVSW